MGYMQHLKDKRKSERGSSEVITTLFMLPIAVWLILSLIDVSLYFQTRTSVQNVTRDAARQTAMWGGNNSTLGRHNLGNKTVAQNAFEALYDIRTETCRPGNCSEPPIVTCTPNQTTIAGQNVSCTTTYHYRAINPANPMGFAGFLSDEIVMVEYARAETGFR